MQNQTYTNFEVILLDDNSDDGSEIIAEEFAKSDERFLYHKLQKQKSIAAVRNIGLKLATGKYLAWVDSDDIVAKDFLLVLHSLITSGNYQMSTCRSVKTKNRHHKLSNAKGLKSQSLSALETQKSCLSSNKIGGFLMLKLFVTEIAQKISFYDNLKSAEDLVFVIEYLNLCQNVCVSNKKLYLYFMRSGSLSRTYKLSKMLNFVKAMNLLVKNSKQKPYYAHVVCWRAMMCCMPIFLSHREMRSKNAKKLKMLFAKYFEEANSFAKQKSNGIKLYSKFVIGLFNILYKGHIKNANRLLKNQ